MAMAAEAPQMATAPPERKENNRSRPNRLPIISEKSDGRQHTENDQQKER